MNHSPNTQPIGWELSKPQAAGATSEASPLRVPPVDADVELMLQQWPSEFGRVSKNHLEMGLLKTDS